MNATKNRNKVRTSEHTEQKTMEYPGTPLKTEPLTILPERTMCLPAIAVSLELDPAVQVEEIKNSISRELKKAGAAFFKVACLLHKVYKKKLFVEDGCHSIYEFASKNFKISRGTCNNYINICERFGEFSEDGTCKSLIPKYKNFSTSQLISMVSIRDHDLLETISPDMTVKEIRSTWRDFKQHEKQKEPVPDNLETVVNLANSKIMNSEKLPYSTLNGEYLIAEADDACEINSKLRMELLDKLTDFKNVNPGIPVHIHISMVWDVPASHMEVQEGKQPETK